MDSRGPADPSPQREDDGSAQFAHDTWNSAEWIARHRALTPGERIELAVAISRAALQFAHARPVARDGG